MADEQASENSPPGAPDWTPLPVEKVAWLFPQFAILGMLGRGTVGAVYRGFDAAADRTVAIKVFPLEISRAPGVARTFAKTLPGVAQLVHAHIVRVHEFGITADDRLFLIADHVEGSTFRDRIDSRKLTPAQTFAIIEQVCDAAHHAHAHGVLHGALHPGNIFVDQHGPVKVADFGIARFRLADSVRDRARAYLAPEQVNDLPVDRRADVFSTGVMLYEALTGELPHADAAPASECAAVHPRIDAVIARAMHSTPDGRYPSIAELMRAIAEVRSLRAKGGRVSTAPVRVVPLDSGPSRTRAAAARAPQAVGKKTPVPLLVGAGVGAVLLGVAAFFAGQHGKKPDALPTPVVKVAEWPTISTPTPASVPKTVAVKPAAAPKPASTPAPTPMAVPGDGTWVSVPLDAGRISGATAVEGGGVHVKTSVKFDHIQGRDIAVRAKIRLVEKAPKAAQLWLRQAPAGRAEIVLDGKPSCFIQTTLKDSKSRPFGSVTAPWVMLGDRWVTVEFAAVGDQLFGAVNGRAIPAATPGDLLKSGGIGLFSSDADFKDLEVMILDGVALERYPDFLKTALAAMLIKTAPEAAAPPMAPAAAEPPPPKASPEVETWLAMVAKPFEENFQREVITPFETAIAELRKRYVATIDAQIAATSQSAKLDEALGWRKERKLFFDSGHKMPADDSDNPLPAIKPLRAAFRAQFAKLDRDRFDRARAHFGPYDAVLAQNQTLLTQRERLDDALLLKSKREQLAMSWLLPPASVPPPIASGPPIGSKATGVPEPAKQGLRETVAWLLANRVQLTVQDGNKWGPVIDARLLPIGKPAFRVNIDAGKFKTPPTAEEMQRLKTLRAVATFESNQPLGDAAWAFLRDLEGVERVQIPGDKLTDAIAESLAPLTQLKSLQLRGGPNWTGKTFDQLAKISTLRNLDVDYSGFNDEGAAAVSTITSLDELYLRKTKITDAGLVHLAKLRNLRRLALNGTAVTADGLGALKGLKNLESIGFLTQDLPDYAGAVEKMSVFFPRLLSTRVQGKALGKEHFAALASWRSLTQLTVIDSELLPGATAGIAQLNNLEWLEISNTVFGDIDIEPLLGMRALKRISLGGTKVTDSGLLKLKAVKNLKEVNVPNTPVTPEGMRALERVHAGCKVTK